MMVKHDDIKTLEILLIEDNEDDAERIEKSLDPVRYHITNVWNGKKAFDILIKQDNDIDVVLLDKGLPYKNGLEILKETKENGKDYAFIFLTIDNTVETAVEAMKLGALDFLPKSSGFKGLPEMIDKVYEIHENKLERKKAEDALSVANTIINRSPAVAFLWKNEEGWPVEFVSENVDKLVGYSPQEFLEGKISYGEIIHSNDLERVAGEVASYSKMEGLQTFEHEPYRIITKNGDIKWVDDISYIRRDSRGIITHYEGIVYDVTDRKRSEEALRESEEKYRMLADNSMDVIWQMNLKLVFIYASPSVTNIMGYTVDEWVGTRLSQHASTKEFFNMARKALYAIKHYKEFKTLTFDVVMLRKDGTEIPVEITSQLLFNKKGLPIGLQGTTRDITKRKQAEESMQESEERLRTIFDTIQAGFVVIDAETHTIVDANPTAVKTIGAPKERIIGHVCHKYICPAEKGKCPITDLGQEMDNSERILLKANGEEVPILKTVTPILLSGKECLLDSFIDITEKKKLEAQFQQAQKMEAVGRLAGGVAHDFNNLLSIVIGNAELMLMGLAEDDPFRKKLEQIKGGGERAASLTRQLLAFSRKQILQPVALDLNLLISGFVKMLERLIGEDVELETALAPELRRVEADPGQIEQVIMNLVINARDAMPDGGKLNIKTVNADLDEDYTKEHDAGLQPGPYVMFAVSDTGMGMDEETHALIFEPFFTTKEEGKGTGLGLSTVYGIVKQSGGHIWVYSEPGQGTTFKTYLPAVEGKTVQVQKEQASADLTGSETILIVEDDDALRNLGRKILELQGYKILEAENGIEALKVSEEHGGQIHLMITDVVMPKMGGRELEERLRPLRPKMKVVYMSGYTDETIVNHGVLKPGIEFLQKPLRSESLKRKVREVLDA